MARPKAWLNRISYIVKHLDDMPETELLSRKDVERLFRVGRSAAGELMEVIGTRPFRGLDGGAAVSVEGVRRYLQTSPDAHAALIEAARRQRLAQQLQVADEEQKLRRVRIPIASADEWCTLAALPNVRIEDGILQVAFNSPRELMADLYRLVKAAGNDWDAFERACAAKQDERKAG